MDENLTRAITRAKELLSTSRHAAMATVNEDGSPHNTPFRFLYDPELKFVYWGSHPNSIHSVNVARTGKIFVVLYDRNERGGLYIKCEKAHMLAGGELKNALAVHNSFRAREGSEPLELDYYTGESPQRMWGATLTNFWINTTEKDKNGHLARDSRQEVTAQDLL
jgi:hypothetical protein